MLVYQRGPSWEAWSPAKVNLLLEVLGKRDDGFHEIESLMVPIGIYDWLKFNRNPTPTIKVSCRWAWAGPTSRTGQGALPDSDENLVTRAVRELQTASGVSLGAEVLLVKRIPMAAGLGGGSGNAAAALLLANRAWNLGWSKNQLAEVAARIGSDVPFFLEPRAAVARGRGEQIEPVKGLGGLHMVVVQPSEGLSTRDVYAACRPADQPKQAEALVEAAHCGDRRSMCRHLFNRLQEPACRLAPSINRIQNEMNKQPVWGHAMTGSGTAYFGLCANRRSAKHVASHLRSRNLGQVLAVTSCPSP